MSDFVHLHNHTEFSSLDGAQKLKNMIAHAVKMGHEALAITDHGSGAGWYKFAAYCREAGIKPIIGIEAYLTVGGRSRMQTSDDYDIVESSEDDGDFDPSQTESQREKSATKKKYYEHITLIAMNETGWRNIVKMVNETARSYRFKPRMDYDLLEQHSEGIICLTGCLAGPVLGYAARAGLEPARIERKVLTLTTPVKTDRGTRETPFATLMRDYDNLISKGLVKDGDLPSERALEGKTVAFKKTFKPLIDDFVETWKQIARDYLVPETPRSGVTLNLDEDGAIGKRKRVEMIHQAEANLRRLIDIFGEDRTFVEVMEHGIEFESDALPILAKLADRNGVRMVATNDAHYTEGHEAGHHDTLLNMQRDGFSFNGSGYFLRTGDQMRELRDEDWWAEACDNSLVVADMCEDIVPVSDGGLPEFPMVRETHHGEIDVTQFDDTPQGHRALLREIVRTGMARKGHSMTDVLRARLNHEFKVVGDKGFIDYYLMVWDLLLWARANGIYVGMGRGSVAGSATAYYAEISWVDPIEEILYFERFLEANRADYPDMDLDFEQRRRGEVIAYIGRKYGKDYVARIGTLRVAASKSVVKDVVRVYGGSPTFANALTKLIPMDGAKPRSLNKFVKQPEAEKFLAEWEKLGDHAEEALITALAIEGTVIGESIHACGTLISNRPLVDLIPLRKDTKKSLDESNVTDITQWEAKDIESYGLLKLDILGLRNLDVVSDAVRNIRDNRGEEIDIYYGMPDPNDLSDPRVARTYALFSEGKTAGVFQMESSSITELARRLRADCFGDLSALIALHRPGPMGADMHTMYADRKNGREEVDYSIYTSDVDEQKWIERVLGITYGTFVYQEQLMDLGTLFAGFDAIWRNKLRKATAKKLPEMLEEVGKEWFANYDKEFFDADGNMISPKFSRQTAEVMWQMMQASAEYLFNKAHSAAYGLLTYITAYLKANYPAEYGAAILSTTDTGKADKRRAAFAALRDEGIEILPPDVNSSRARTFPHSDTSVIIGLAEIKGVGAAGAAVAAERHFSDLSKPFRSLHDMVNRVVDTDGKAILSTADLGGLIEAGACDSITDGYRKGAMIVSRASKDADIPVPPMEWGVVERSARQRAKIGVGLGESPLTTVRDQLRAWRVPDERRFGDGGGSGAVSLSAIPHEADLYFTTIGILSGYTERSYAGGTAKLAGVTLEGTNTSIEGVMFQRALNSLDFAPSIGQIVAASGFTRVNDWSPPKDDDDDAQPDDLEEDEGGTVEEVESRLELSINRMWAVDLVDEHSGDLYEAELTWSAAVEEYEDSRPEPDPEDDTDPDGDDDPEGSDDDTGTDAADETDDSTAEPEFDESDTPMVFASAEPARRREYDDRGIPNPEPWFNEPDPPEPDDYFDDSDDEDEEPRSRTRDDDDDEEPVKPRARKASEIDDFDFDSVPLRAPDDEVEESLVDLPSFTPPGDPKVTPIYQKQVENGTKVPVIWNDGTSTDQSRYSSMDSDVVRRFKTEKPRLEEVRGYDDGLVVVRLFYRQDYATNERTLRYVHVTLHPFGDIHPAAIIPLFDADKGKPQSIEDLVETGSNYRKETAP